jgi:hypothetical protein
MDPDRACPHENFSASVEVSRLSDSEEPGAAITGYAADIKVWCDDCGEPFRWIGVQAGLNPQRPMCSVDETEMRAPIRPASSDPDFGMGIPGFAVTWREG